EDEAARDRSLPVRRSPEDAHARALGEAEARGANSIHRVDRRRAHAPPRLPRPARRQEARRVHAREAGARGGRAMTAARKSTPKNAPKNAPKNETAETIAFGTRRVSITH